MTRLGFVSLEQLGRIQRETVKPEDAFRQIVADAKAKHPAAHDVILQREPNGFAVLGMAQ